MIYMCIIILLLKCVYWFKPVSQVRDVAHWPLVLESALIWSTTTFLNKIFKLKNGSNLMSAYVTKLLEGHMITINFEILRWELVLSKRWYFFNRWIMTKSRVHRCLPHKRRRPTPAWTAGSRRRSCTTSYSSSWWWTRKSCQSKNSVGYRSLAIPKHGYW